MTTKKRLGRGLDALLSGSREDKQISGSEKSNDTLKEIPLESLQRGRYQPRIDMRQESLEELASSIKSQGIVQPLAVRPVASNSDKEARYEIIAGERRWRAAQIAGLKSVPVVIKNIPDSDAIAMALIENIQRENLNPFEEALALNRLIKEFDITHQEAANAVGRSRSSVSNILRLLELPETIADFVKSRKIEMGHARALLSINAKSLQIDIAKMIIKKGLSVREVERLAKQSNNQLATKKAKKDSLINPDIQRLEISMSEKLGAKLKIDHKNNGNGKIIINYNSLDELEGIIDHIK